VPASYGALSTATTLQITMFQVSLDCILSDVDGMKVSLTVEVTNIHFDLFQQTLIFTRKTAITLN
jgi:hypothetical protein